MHWFKRNIGDYHKKAGRLTMLQHGAYTLLMDSCYDREKFPTKEEALDWVWASTPEEIHAVEFVLSRFFVLENGIYTQPRIAEEISGYQAKAENNKRIALEREAKRRESKTKEHESCTEGEQVVNETPPNQEPITNNHKPVTNIKIRSIFDAERIIPIWNSLGCSQHKGLTKTAEKALEKTYKEYLKDAKSNGKEPKELNDWLETYLRKGFANFMTDHHRDLGNGQWSADLEFAVRFTTYDKIKNMVKK